MNNDRNAQAKTEETPPIGLKPKSIHDLQRIQEIEAAIHRYIEAKVKIPEEWITEYNYLIENYRNK